MMRLKKYWRQQSFFFLLFCASYHAMAQNINGEKIVVADGALTYIKFHDEISRYELGDRDGYTCQPRDIDNSIVIKSTSPDAPTTNLVVTEGKRTHYFIVVFQKEIDINNTKLSYDYSSLKDLRKLVKDKGEQPAPELAVIDQKNEEKKKKDKDKKEPEPDSKQAKREKEEAEKLREKEQKYGQAMAKGNKAFDAKDYDAAKSAYYEALGVKPDDEAAKKQLAKLNETAGAAAKEKEAAQKEKKAGEQYAAALAKADKAATAKQYTEARAAYNEALSYRPNDQFAKDRLTAIEKQEAQLAAIANAEKEKAAQLKALDENYKSAIDKADKALKAKDYDQAKAAYYEALSLKPNEAYAKNKLNDIDQLLTARATEAAKAAAEKDRLAKQKALDDKYDAAIGKADKALNAKDYDGAKTAYYEAISLKPAETYPKSKLTDISKTLEEKAAADKAERTRLAKEAEINTKFTQLMAAGDKAMSAKNYTSAKQSYYAAISLKPDATQPKEKLSAIDKLQEAQAIETARIAAEKEQAAKENQLTTAYKNALAKADKAFTAKQYDAAKKAYYEAVAIKPDEQYPKDRLSAVEKAIADEAVAKAKAAEEQQRLAKLKEEEQEYKGIITAADKALAAKNYEGAKAGYEQALRLRGDDKATKGKLDNVEKTLATLAEKKRIEDERLAKLAAEAEKARQEALDPHQKQAIPYSQAILFKKYPNISFGNPPAGQKLTADFFFAKDTLENSLVSKKLIADEAELGLQGSDDSVRVVIENLGFSGVNSYFKIRIKNLGKGEFLTGAMLLNWKRKDGKTLPLYGCYISSFPLLLPGKEFVVVYACRAINTSNDEQFTFQLSDRKNRSNIDIEIPGKVYNEQMNHHPIPRQTPPPVE